MTSTLVELLRHRAEATPARTAFRFLGDEDSAVSTDYAALDRDARKVAGLLREQGAATGDRALLLYPPGLDYIRSFFGALYAGVVPVPVYPPRTLRNVGRLGAIAADSRARFALTVGPVLDLLGDDDTLGLGGLRAAATDELPEGLADAWSGRMPDPDGHAFLQYTSGSTATPKGVVLSHGNLLHNLGMISDAFACHEDTSAVVWLPPYHDMGLIGGILTPLYAGFPVTLMSPMSFLRRPLHWLRTISREGAELSGGPNFAYEMCARLATDEDKRDLDLSTWRVAFNGAEPIRAATLDAFEEAFGACGFRRGSFLPCYGMAEATLFVTGAPASAEPTVLDIDAAALETDRVQAPTPDSQVRRLVGSGRAAADQEVLIVEPESRIPLPERRVGEIWVRGASVALGYWDDPQASEQAFGARTAPRADDGGGIGRAGDAAYLRTGDLGFLADGELFVTGRRKDLLIVRGRNFYPTDIELAVEGAHPAFRSGCGAAVTAEHDGEQVLVVLQEVEGRALRTLSVPEATASVRAAVMEACDLAVHAVVLLKPGAIPKTTSGKVQRSLARKRYASGAFEPLGGDAAAEPAAELPGPGEVAELASADRAALVARVLRLRIAQTLGTSPDEVGTTLPLPSLGIDSLAAVLLANGVRGDLGVELSLGRMLGGADIDTLAAEATLVPGADSGDGEEREERPADAMSVGQRAIWHLQQQDPEASAYNIPVALRLSGGVDAGALERALGQVVSRHEMLRTRYRVLGGETVPFPVDGPVALELIDARADDPERLAERLYGLAHRPFDLEHDGVLRAHLLTLAEREHVFLMTVHHIAADLWSLVTLSAELGRCYAAQAAGAPLELPAPAARYADHARRERRMAAGPEGAAQRAYWQTALAGPLPLLDVPLDAPHPPAPSYRGARIPLRVEAERADRLRKFARECGTTLHTVLLSAFHIALHHASGQDDIVVGTAAANRGARDVEEVVGYFTNVLAVRASLAEGVTGREVTGRLHETVLRALDHQTLPLPLVLESVQPPRAPGRNPLFQAVFVLQRPHVHAETAAFVLGTPTGAGTSWGELRVTPQPLAHRTAQYELMLTVVDTGPELHAALEYSTDVFTEQSARRLAAHYRAVLEDLLERPDRPIAELCPADMLTRRAERDAATEEDDLTGYVAPRTDSERVLAKIWSEVLGVEPIGVEDDFYDLGGHSLLAVQLISGVRDALGVDVPVRSVMQTRTVAQGAAVIDALLWARESAPALGAREDGEL
ncbi:condensation domain-containing protein [Streptomyces sp. NPDC006259]|uniref:condensation domain-containing protein n=1 Tax=Streptomyces sp. NPDC006259 TaxID=3364740 RepID=UPI00369428A7